ncbi:MAG: hypothetical protein C0489_04085 [Candidatus Accumulibacter sp.]|nr:hypothetical protein [Accumulibacter sp.]MBA4093246.1 hypothetical protein [Accumulibacter sp.]
MGIVRSFAAIDTEPVGLIVSSCTHELRMIYAPKPDAGTDAGSVFQSRHRSSRIVAVDDAGTIAGVAECVGRAAALYVQGIAVAPTHRRCGVATNLLAHCASLAASAELPFLEIATIKETGNVEIFLRLGFIVIDERVSECFWSYDRQPVTEVRLRRCAV